MRNQTNPQTEKLYERQIHRQNNPNTDKYTDRKALRQSYTQTENIQKERQIPAQTTKINPLLVFFILP